MSVKAGYLLLAGGGGILIWSGVRNKSATGVFRALIGGESPNRAGSNQPTTGNAGTTSTGIPSTVQSTGSVTTGTQSFQGGPVTNPQQAQAYAFSLLPRFGWDSSQQQPLLNLWNQESGWNANAVNQSSGAYGIPQDLPSANGRPYALGWGAATAQILWGLNYIKQRYGSPAAAWAHEQSFNWY